MCSKAAIIDLGSNSVRLVLTEINDDRSFRIVNEVKEMVRLSENMTEDGILKPNAIGRTIKAIKLFKSLCEASHVEDILAVATAAVRNALNRKEFLRLLEEETGIHFRVISGEEEAELGVLAVQCTMEINSAFIVDVGGASTEITQVIGGKIKNRVSIPFGAVNLTEMFINKGDSANGAELLENFLRDRFKAIPWLRSDGTIPLIGLGGTIRNICKIDRVKKGYSLDITHNYEMNDIDVLTIYQDIRNKNPEEIADIPGISKERIDIITAGSCIVKTLITELNIRKLFISGNGIREGIFFRYYMNRFNIDEIKDVSKFSTDNILKLYGVNLAHSRHVTRLSLKAYDQLRAMIDIEGEYRRVFEKAAILHDVGINIDFYNRDKHTYYIITNCRINGLSHRDIALTAIIASGFTGDKLKYHYMKHTDLLSKEDYKAVKKLMAILTICDKLDRSKSGVIRDINCFMEKDSIIIKTDKVRGGELEISEARKQEAAFYKAFKKKLVVI